MDTAFFTDKFETTTSVLPSWNLDEMVDEVRRSLGREGGGPRDGPPDADRDPFRIWRCTYPDLYTHPGLSNGKGDIAGEAIGVPGTVSDSSCIFRAGGSELMDDYSEKGVERYGYCRNGNG
jgi:hypothetical protein